MANDKVYEIVTERILASLEKGVVPWRTPWRTSYPKNLKSGKEYKGVNIFLLGMQMYASPWWLTYKQCAEMGGQVRKGEKSSIIVKWTIMEDKHGKVNKDGSPKKFGFLRYFNVFNVSQCDGIDVPPAENISTPSDPIPTCERIIDGWAEKPAIVHGGNRACYNPSQDRISMPVRESFGKVEEYYSTLFHEMVHSTGHMSRLGREGITNPIKFASHSYSFEELVAECGASFLCAHAGIIDQTIDNSASYIASWVSKLKNNPKWIIQAANQASKAVDLIRGAKAEEDTYINSEAA